MAVGNSTAIGAALWEVKSKMQEVNNVGIYCRLSRDDERSGESVSIENQKELLGRHAREQGWTIIDYYVDDGVSGTTFDRPGFNRLVQDARDGKINIALCKDLSRLGRDYLEAGKYTSIVFPSLGCRFIALNDGVDTTRQNDEMVMILKNVMNDLYARDTSSKIKAVKRSSFKAGKYVGCYAPIGYQKSPDDKQFLKSFRQFYYEEDNLHMMLISMEKDYGRCLEEMKRFLPYVDNWSTCDFAPPRCFGKHKQELLPEIRNWISSGQTYVVRYGVGLLMRLYLDRDFKPEYLEEVASVRSEEYYVNMMIAWYFATALAKQWEAALPYLEGRRLPLWVHRKAIQKAVESYRIQEGQKAYLKGLK